MGNFSLTAEELSLLAILVGVLYLFPQICEAIKEHNKLKAKK